MSHPEEKDDLPGRFTVGRRTIAVRIALLAWAVSLVTLFVFVAVMIEQQKEVYVQQLESKARGVVVALRDALTGAAINEDIAELVASGQVLINGDQDLDFLVINKNDSFALITQRSGWTVENEAGRYWQPESRQISASISTVPGIGLRSFHYAQPFDYSGIEWGWIHVGISLRNFDKSMVDLYVSTVVLGVVCALFSLLASLIYARKMIRPLSRLRRVVQDIAGGDMDARAEVGRLDELGDLGVSVNTMVEALGQRNSQLLGAARAIQLLHSEKDPVAGITSALQVIGPATGQCAGYFFKIMSNEINGSLVANKCSEWLASNQIPGIEVIEPAIIQLTQHFDDWLASMRAGDIVVGVIGQLTEKQRAFFGKRNTRSFLMVPVNVVDELYGFIGFENDRTEFLWNENESAVFQSIASSIATALERHRFDRAILEAKTTLELRVQERTRELQSQVNAKEKAMMELAAAQESLMEMSRSAGMAEVATGVLHNVGNVLNSVNVSCNLIVEQSRESRVGNVTKVADLLSNPSVDLAHFLTIDPKGQQIPGYLSNLGIALERERKLILTEAALLHERIEHIKEIVAMQQTYGRVLGVQESLSAEQLMEDALRLNAEAFFRHGIVVRREYANVPKVSVDKHKVLQILLNLINNAKYACSDSDVEERIVTLRISSVSGNRVRMEVIDNGVGIDPENINRIFQHGFTTRRNGHGFGLHSGALAAKLLGGSLAAFSDGPGKGAAFALELPSNGEVA